MVSVERIPMEELFAQEHPSLDPQSNSNSVSDLRTSGSFSDDADNPVISPMR
jgi:hypothetical protein